MWSTLVLDVLLVNRQNVHSCMTKGVSFPFKTCKRERSFINKVCDYYFPFSCRHYFFFSLNCTYISFFSYTLLLMGEASKSTESYKVYFVNLIVLFLSPWWRFSLNSWARRSFPNLRSIISLHTLQKKLQILLTFLMILL